MAVTSKRVKESIFKEKQSSLNVEQWNPRASFLPECVRDGYLRLVKPHGPHAAESLAELGVAT